MDPDHSTARSGTGVTIGPLSVAEVAALLEVEQRTVIKYRQHGKILGEKHGKSWRLWLSQDFIDSTRAERSGTHSGMDPDRHRSRSGTPPDPIEASYTSTTPAMVEQAIERTGARYVADFAALYDRISAEVGRLYEAQLEAKDQAIIAQGATLAAKDETISTQQEVMVELRHRVGLAEAVTKESQDALAEQATTIAELQRRAVLVEQEAAALRAQLSPPVVAQDEPKGDHRTPEASAAENAPGGGLWGKVSRWWRGT
jgi:hypothetical protein